MIFVGGSRTFHHVSIVAFAQDIIDPPEELPRPRPIAQLGIQGKIRFDRWRFVARVVDRKAGPDVCSHQGKAVMLKEFRIESSAGLMARDKSTSGRSARFSTLMKGNVIWRSTNAGPLWPAVPTAPDTPDWEHPERNPQRTSTPTKARRDAYVIAPSLCDNESQTRRAASAHPRNQSRGGDAP